MKLEDQYKEYLKNNPESKYSFDEWFLKVWEPKNNEYLNVGEDGKLTYLEDMSIWDITLMDGLEDERIMDFKQTINNISDHLKNLSYANGDISDIGNEVGYSIGMSLENMTEDEIETFISGFRHGVSLTNGTHK
jgi:hypothetical protein